MVIFKNIKWKNFLSFGNQFTEVNLHSNQTTVIVGSNGAGKSTMLDAISFVLYGKPYRNINKPQLINSVNGKECLVEINFTVGKNEYKVIRGIKPNIFEIYEDGKLIDQESHVSDYQFYLEKNILKMNYTAFTQIVVLGKATYVPFMKLKPQDRRNLIEELLGLTIFSKMNEVLKNRLTMSKNEKYELENHIELYTDKINLKKKYIDRVSLDNDERVNKINSDINILKEKNELHQKEYDDILQSKNNLLSFLVNHESTKNKQKNLDKIEYEFNNKIKRIKKDIKFFNDNDVCPTCSQDIHHVFKNEMVDRYTNTLTELENDSEKLNNELKKVEDKIKVFENYVHDISTFDKRLAEIQTSIKYNDNLIDKLYGDLKQNVNVNVDDEKNELILMYDEFEKFKDKKSNINVLLGYYQSIGTMLKDTGIKSVIVQKYLPIFNNFINQYLTKFDFFVKFQLDETFNETILSRNRDHFSYSSFSEGEKLRIDMAILLTWREISKMKNSMSTNLLIMDEIFDSSLDQTGVDAFIDLIPKMEFANIFVISHTPDKLYNKFKNIIEIEKDGNFSVIK